MPKLLKEAPVRVTGSRRTLVASSAYVESLTRVILSNGKGVNTTDLYRLARATLAYFETNPEAKKEFLKWYETL